MSRLRLLLKPLMGTFFVVGFLPMLTNAQVPSQTFTPEIAPRPIRLIAERPSSSGGAVELVLRSERLGRDYQVVVTPPAGSFAAQGRKLPALYVLDGGYGIAGPLAQFLSGAGMMSLAYVVSLGAPDADRLNDFIDTPVQAQGTLVGGGGARFREFLLDELRPYLEARFPIDRNSSTLFGHSLGGLFVARLLSLYPEAFSS